MRSTKPALLLRLAVSVLAPAFLLAVGRGLWGAPLSWQTIAQHLAFAALVLLLSAWTRPVPRAESSFLWPGFLVILGISVVGAGLWLFVPVFDAGGWLLLIGCYGALAGIDEILTARVARLRAWFLRVLVAGAAGAFPVALAQLESRFSDEEFFVAIEVLMLSLVWFVLRTASSWISPHIGCAPLGGKSVRRGVVAVLFCLVAVGGAAHLVRAYQASFYTLDVPEYPGISADQPFLCGEVTPQPASVTGEEVFGKLMALVAENPNKGVPEYGMLALGTGDADWADQFRLGILGEAGEHRFAGPAGSVKYQQYLAAYRLYYFLTVDEAFPNLFSVEERDVLTAWFVAINERALTVEWVDWMYGLAFSAWPEGPYENQETGSALLSLMALGDIGAGDLRARTQAFLERDTRGWRWRFRNTDDAFAYQPEWITNAYYQTQLTGSVSEQNLRKSFEWMALQLAPGGAALSYNHPNVPHLGAVMYLGATLLGDPRYVWLADQVLEHMASLDRYPYAQPGVEYAVTLDGSPPTEGSCLIYGDSGLPNQAGPLAPDKIVLRDGWASDDAYILLNLRFSGWHRYKATNAVSLLHWDGPLVVEVLEARRFEWLPKGRSLFRDKRIPRENLNGLLVERTGMSAVVHSLTGHGGSWAQDPPAYAEVLRFETLADRDWAQTRLSDWHGWTHTRSVYLFHDQGPMVIVDRARGPASKGAAIAWNMVADELEPTAGFILREGESPVAVELVNLGDVDHRISVRDQGAARIGITAQAEGDIDLATVFLPGTWAGADLSWDAVRQILMVTSQSDNIELDLSDVSAADAP